MVNVIKRLIFSLSILNSDDRIVSLNYPFLNNLETTLLPHEILVVPCLMELLPLYCSIQTLHTCFTVLYSNGAESTLPLRDHAACLVLYSTMPQSAIVSMPQFRQPFGSSPEIWHHQSSPRFCSSFFLSQHAKSLTDKLSASPVVVLEWVWCSVVTSEQTPYVQSSFPPII